jgi:hypothetical protein
MKISPSSPTGESSFQLVAKYFFKNCRGDVFQNNSLDYTFFRVHFQKYALLKSTVCSLFFADSALRESSQEYCQNFQSLDSKCWDWVPNLTLSKCDFLRKSKFSQNWDSMKKKNSIQIKYSVIITLITFQAVVK